MADRGLFTDAEVAQLMRALVRSGKPITGEDGERVGAWAAEIRIGQAMLALALQGRKALYVLENGEVALGENKV
jgi:hypothetical protein